ncbi:hypothetical protein CHX26_13915 [Porphyrobacter sp. HT-58-2]|nr:hypothetical protein CHX26_13915 [Porphyrobacter sp. HT-58-2]
MSRPRKESAAVFKCFMCIIPPLTARAMGSLPRWQATLCQRAPSASHVTGGRFEDKSCEAEFKSMAGGLLFLQRRRNTISDTAMLSLEQGMGRGKLTG